MGIFDFLKGGKNPASQAQPYLEAVPGTVQPYYQPYIEQGQKAGGQLQPEFQRMVENPEQLYNQLMSTYPGSDRYQHRYNKMQQQLENAAAAGGYRGTPSDQMAQAELVDAIMRESEGDYLRDIMNIYGTGLTGLENMNTRGYQASTGFGDIMGENMQNRGQLAYQGQQHQNQNNANLINQLIQAITAGGTMAAFPPAGAAMMAGNSMSNPGGYSGQNMSQMSGSNVFGRGF